MVLKSFKKSLKKKLSNQARIYREREDSIRRAKEAARKAANEERVRQAQIVAREKERLRAQSIIARKKSQIRARKRLLPTTVKALSRVGSNVDLRKLKGDRTSKKKKKGKKKKRSSRGKGYNNFSNSSNFYDIPF